MTVQSVMHMGRSSRSWRVSHALVAWCITVVGLTRKSFDGLALRTVLWTRSTRVYGVVGTFAGGQNSATSSRLCSVLLYACETWTLNSDLERRLNVFCAKCLRRIMGYRWNDFVSNQRLLYETESRLVTGIVRELQLRLYGHVALLPDVHPAHRLDSVRDNPGLRRSRGRPRNSWLGKVDRSCLELLGMGMMVAWGLARRESRGWRRRVSDATHPPRMLPIDDDDVRFVVIMFSDSYVQYLLCPNFCCV